MVGKGEEAMTYRDDDPDWNQDCGSSMTDRQEVMTHIQLCRILEWIGLFENK